MEREFKRINKQCKSTCTVSDTVCQASDFPLYPCVYI